MTVKDIITECLSKMGKDNFLSNATLDEDEIRLRDALIDCCNIAYRQVVSRYLPNIHKEEVHFVENTVYTKDLAMQILYPIMLKNEDGVLRFRTYYDRIEAKHDGVATLTYAFMPDVKLSIDDTIDKMDLTQHAMVNGVLKEYYFANKLFELAEKYDIDFRDEMDNLKHTRNFNIKQRRWQA